MLKDREAVAFSRTRLVLVAFRRKADSSSSRPVAQKARLTQLIGMTASDACASRLRSAVLLALVAGLLFLFPCALRLAAAQESALDKGPPPPYVEPAPPPAPPEPTYDPLRAEKSVEIGTFYMKRGNYEAAIERFQDATHFQPKLARPYALLGEAYEKKGELDNAVTNYKKYLQVYGTAPDKEKILKRIEKLESQSGRGPAKKSG